MIKQILILQGFFFISQEQNDIKKNSVQLS